MTAYRSFATAAFALVFAAILLIYGQNLPTGTGSRMGPGFVPHAAAWGLIILGGAIALRGVFEWKNAHPGESLAPFHWRGAACIGVGVAAFALLVQPIGLLASAGATVLISSLAQTGGGISERVLLASFLAAFAGLVFTLALGLPIPVLPAL
jgi:putative tricarboxylic transport membrane protein